MKSELFYSKMVSLLRVPASAILLVLVVCGTLPQGSPAQCPPQCTCEGGTVSCVGQNLTEVPMAIPADTTALLLNDNFITQAAALRSANLPALKQLNLSNNKLYVVESGAYEGFPALENLDLSHNVIVSFNESKSPSLQLPFLKNLNLTRNILLSIEKPYLAGLPKLETLDLSRNGIIDLADVAFAMNPELSRLDLSDNFLVTLFPDMFVQLANLRELKLNNNQIFTMAPDAFRGLENLKSLTLANNVLSVPSDAPFRNLTALLDVDLANNTWVCELACELTAVQSFISQRPIYKQQFLCTVPESLQGQYVENIRIPTDELGCPESSGSGRLWIGSSTTLVMTFIALCYLNFSALF